MEGTIWKTKTRQDDDNTNSSEDNYSHLVVANEDEHNIFDMLEDSRSKTYKEKFLCYRFVLCYC